MGLDLDTLDAAQRMVEGHPAVPLDAAQLEKLPELLTHLEGELSTFETLNQGMNINKIQEFAIQVQEWGTSSDYPPLKKWGKDLNLQASQFDIESMRKSLKQFPQLIETIQSLLGGIPSGGDPFE